MFFKKIFGEKKITKEHESIVSLVVYKDNGICTLTVFVARVFLRDRPDFTNLESRV